MIELKGLGTALVTPFLEDGSIDYDAYAALIDRQVAAGVDFLVPLATTGETPTLSAEEKKKLLAITKAHAAGLPLLVGAGSNSVPGTLANMELLAGLGADAWLVVVPFYNKPTQEGQYRYFCEIARRSSLPLVLYNVPGRTGANMLPETCLRIARDCPNVIAIKEASGKIEQVQAILDGAPEGFCVLSGDDDMTFDMMSRGAAGAISVASNIEPEAVGAPIHLMQEAALADDPEQAETMVAAASELDEDLQPLYKACFVESNPIPAKAALALKGLCTAAMRLPLVEASESTKTLMKEILK